MQNKLSIISIFLLIIYIGLSLFFSTIAGYGLDKIIIILAVIYIFNLAFTIAQFFKRKSQLKITKIAHILNLIPFLMAIIFLLLVYLQFYLPQIWDFAGDKTFLVIFSLMIFCSILSATTSFILLLISTFKNRKTS